MKTQLCVRCGELVPQGCCTCGDKQELKPLGWQPPDLAQVMGDALGKLLEWHDEIRQYMGPCATPYDIEEIRAAYAAWKEVN